MLGMANETEKRWAARVSEWRTSGLTSTKYCEGRDFTPGGLRHWAYRLRKDAAAKTALVRRPTVQVLRVERVPEVEVKVKVAGRAPTSLPLRIKLGAARLAVPAGFDGGTLRTVLEVLVASVGRPS